MNNIASGLETQNNKYNKITRERYAVNITKRKYN